MHVQFKNSKVPKPQYCTNILFLAHMYLDQKNIESKICKGDGVGPTLGGWKGNPQGMGHPGATEKSAPRTQTPTPLSSPPRPPCTPAPPLSQDCRPPHPLVSHSTLR